MATDVKLPAAVQLHPDKPLLYASPLILKRRHRLLRCAQDMIEREGVEDFSVRKLCREAGVAYATVYNAFHDRDRVIVLAIAEAWSALSMVRPKSLKDIILHNTTFDYFDGPNRNLVRAVTSVYFSCSTRDDIWHLLRSFSAGVTSRWLGDVARGGGMNAWYDQEEFDTIMANSLYSAANDWLLKRVSDEKFVYRVAEIMLILIADVAKGQVHEEAVEYLRTMRASGRFIN